MNNLNERIKYGPVLTPTEEEFKDFRKYISKISTDKKYLEAGCVKVIPPKSFKKESLFHPSVMDSLNVVRPIEQQIYKKKDLYELRLLTKKSMSLREYKEIVDKDELLLPKRNMTPEEIETFVI